MGLKQELERNTLLTEGHVFSDEDVKQKLIDASKKALEVLTIKPTEEYTISKITTFLKNENLTYRVSDNAVTVYWMDE